MAAEWHFAINTFMVRTGNSQKRAFELSTYHLSVLQGSVENYPLDADYAVMLARYAPAHEEFARAYRHRSVEDGRMQGCTLDLQQLLTELRGRLNTWQAMVKVAGFARNSAEYKGLFPSGVAPFFYGAKDERITAVGALIVAMQAHASLSAVQALATDFHQQLMTARQEQLGHKGSKKNWSAVANNARKAVLTEQYRNLGRLIEKFADKPQFIKPFFQLQLLRKR